MTANYSPVGQARVPKGTVTPTRPTDVGEVVCKAASTQNETVNHTLVNVDDFSTVCQTCGKDWVTLDAEMRRSASRADRARTKERAAELKAKHEAEEQKATERKGG